MIKPVLKNVAYAAFVAAGLTLASCGNNNKNETETGIEPSETERETFEQNEMDTQADTTARVNRENPEMSAGEQVP